MILVPPLNKYFNVKDALRYTRDPLTFVTVLSANESAYICDWMGHDESDLVRRIRMLGAITGCARRSSEMHYSRA